MCQAFSCVLHKTKGVLRPKDLYNHSHSSIIQEHRLSSNKPAENRDWIRIEASPNDNDYFNLSPSNWAVNVDDDGVPTWYEDNTKAMETKVILAIKNWIADGEASVGVRRTPSGRKSRAKVQTHAEAFDLWEGPIKNAMIDKANALRDKIDALENQIENLETQYADAEPMEEDYASTSLQEVLGIE